MSDRTSIRAIRGISLLELMMAVVILSIMALGVHAAASTAGHSMKTSSTLLDAQTRATRCLDKATRHLRAASVGSIATLPEGLSLDQPLEEEDVVDNVSFSVYQTGSASVALPTLSSKLGLRLEPSPHDPVNGFDDDGDCLIDEKQLMLDRPGTAPEVLGGNVTRFDVSLAGNELSLSLRVELPQGEGLCVAEASRRIAIRND